MMKNIFTLIILITILKTGRVFSQEHFTRPPFQNNPLYNTLYGTDCSIPKGVQLVHYPMSHPIIWPAVLNLFERKISSNLFIHHDIAYSSFQFIQLVKQYPSAVVFDEMFYGNKEILSFKNRYYRDIYFNFLIPIVAPFFNPLNRSNFVFNSWRLEHTDSYEQLTTTELGILSSATGGMVAYALGLLDHLYPVTIYSDYKEVYNESGRSELPFCFYCFTGRVFQFNSSHNETEKEKIKQRFYNAYRKWRDQYQEFLSFMGSWREQALADFVFSVLEEEDFSNNPVIIAYGAAHDLTDSFTGRNLYTLPLSCTQRETKGLFEIALSRYYSSNNPENKQILRQYIEDKWSRMSLNQRNEIDKHFDFRFISRWALIPVSEQIRRVIAEEPLFHKQNAEFVFNHLTKMDPEALKQFAKITGI